MRVDPGAFAARLRQHRSRAGLTQEELAERAGLSVDAIGLLERGVRQRPQRHTVQRLAEALGLGGADHASFVGAARPGVASWTPPPLPAASTPFVGREAEVHAAVALLGDPDVRLLTLVGMGGIGKTRLALEIAARLDGPTVLLSLAELTEPAQVAPELVRSLGLPEQAGRTPTERAVAFLRDRAALLLVDNAEHLVAEAAAVVAAVLAGCPRVRVLATSRTPLNLTSEQRLPVPALTERAAAMIIEQRARAVAPGFRLSPETTEDVLAICRRLDGLPLALELAAPWLRLLAPSELLARLDRRLDLLERRRAADLPERQQTLRRVLTWSHELLPPRARGQVASLAVFAGGCTEDAAVAVAGADLRDLAELVDASVLVSQQGVAGPRFAMLETVREFAAEQLGDGVAERRRHADHFLDLAVRAQLVGPEEATWTRRLAEEDANLHAAIGHALNTGDLAAALRFARELWRYWSATGQLAEGLRWLEATLELAGTTLEPLEHAELELWTATIARQAGRYERAERLYRACLARRPQVGDADTLVAAEHNLGVLYYEMGELDRAVEIQRRTVAAARRNRSGYGLPFGLVSLGDVERARGELDAAAEHYAEGLALFRRIGHALGEAQALAGLGHIAAAENRLDDAARLFDEGLDRTAGLPDIAAVSCLTGLARTRAAQGALVDAMENLTAAAELLEHSGAARPAHDQAAADRLAAELGQPVADAGCSGSAVSGSSPSMPTNPRPAAADRPSR